MAISGGHLPWLINTNSLEGVNSKNPLLNLPKEILLNIIRKTDGVTALGLRRVCKDMRNQVDHLTQVDLKNIQNSFVQIHIEKDEKDNYKPGSAVTLSPLGQELVLNSPLINKYQLGFILKKPELIKMALMNIHLNNKKVLHIRTAIRRNIKKAINSAKAHVGKIDELNKIRTLIKDLHELKNLVVEHPSMNSSQLHSYVFQTKGKENHAEEVVQNPNTSGKLLHRIFEKNQDNDFILAMIAEHPNLEGHTARKLADRNDSTIDEYLAGNRATPKDILDQLARRNDMTHEALAGNSSCDKKTLDFLWDNGSQRNTDILIKLAKNPSLSSRTFDAMMVDSSLHNALAQNPCLSLYPHHVQTLKSSDNDRVRQSLAQNTYLKDIADELSDKSQSSSVRAAAARNPQLSAARIDELYESKEKVILIGLAQNPMIDSKKINTLALHEDKDISASAAMSSKLTDETLLKLSESKDPEIQKALVINNAMQLYFDHI